MIELVSGVAAAQLRLSEHHARNLRGFAELMRAAGVAAPLVADLVPPEHVIPTTELEVELEARHRVELSVAVGIELGLPDPIAARADVALDGHGPRGLRLAWLERGETRSHGQRVHLKVEQRRTPINEE